MAGSEPYDAFVSYSHAADGLLAPSLQNGLQRFAKPWWKRRALRIFRDDTGLSANPHLWESIATALDASDWFIVLASPDAAASEWVGREIRWWLEHRDPDRILPVLTDGTLEWDASSGGFASSSSAAHPELAGAFRDEPRWIDLRWAHTEEHLDLDNVRFRDTVADLAAPIRGMAKDELASEDVRQHRRTRRTAWAAAATVALLAIAASTAAVFAIGQRDAAREERARAEDQARIADARSLSASATALAPTRLDSALLLGAAGVQLDGSSASLAGLATAIEAARHLTAAIDGPDRQFLAPGPEPGTVTVVTVEGDVVIWDLQRAVAVGEPMTRVASPWGYQATSNGSAIALSNADRVEIVDLVARTTTVHELGDLERGPAVVVGISPDGTQVLVVRVYDPSVEVWDARSGEVRGHLSVAEPDGSYAPLAAFSPDGTLIYLAHPGGHVGVFDAGTLDPVVGPITSELQTSAGIVASPRGDLVAVAPFGAVRVNVLDATTLDPILPPVPVDGQLSYLEFSPDGSRLAIGVSSGTATIVDTSTGSVHTSVTGVASASSSFAWVNDSTLVSGPQSGPLLVWDTERGSVADPTGVTSSTASDVASLPAGALLVTTDAGASILRADGTVHRIEIDTPCGAVDATSDGSLAALGCGSDGAWSIVRLDPVSGAVVDEIPVHQEVSALAFSRDGVLAVGSYGGDLSVFDSTGAALLDPVNIDPEFVFALSWVDEDASVVAGGRRGAVLWFDTTTWDQTDELLLEPDWVVTDFAVAADGRMFVAMDTGNVWQIDVAERQPTGEPVGARVEVWSLALSDDGTILYALGSGLQQIDADSFRLLGPAMTGHRYFGSGAAVSGGLVYTSGLDQFDPSTGTLTFNTVVWDLGPRAMVEQACRLVGRDLSPRERDEFLSPQRQTLDACDIEGIAD